MVVMVLERVPSGLRGELTRWLLEPRTGVFVGTPSAIVREKLWARVCVKLRDGAAVLVHSASNEQGFLIETWGLPSRLPLDFEGLLMICQPTADSSDTESDERD